MGWPSGDWGSGAAQLAREIAQLETGHLVFERAERDPEVAGRRRDVPVRLLERAEDEVALEGVAGLLKQRFARRLAGVQLREVVLERQVFIGDPFLVADGDKALDQVLQLTDVAWPPVRREDLQRRVRDPEHRLSELDPIALQEEPGQLRKVV